MKAYSKRLFTVTASYSQPAAGPDGKLPPPIYQRNSFTIMSYARE
jgi:hypothetical protein